MTCLRTALVIALIVSGSTIGFAVEISGTVREVTGDTAIIVTDGDIVPSVGDKVHIFFKLAGANDEISVGSGKVTAVNATSIKIKIDNATGTVNKGQLARFTSGTPQKEAAASTSPLSRAADKSAAHPSIIGSWVGIFHDGTKDSFTFKDDQTFAWTIESSDSQQRMTGHAKYRLDYTTKPHHIDIFGSDQPDLVPKGETLLGLFEFQSDSRLKLDLSILVQKDRDKGFTDGAIIFSRVP